MTRISTANLRDAWIGHSLSALCAPGTTSRQVSDSAARVFDAWLDQQRTGAWEEGRTAGRSDTHDHPAPNPYEEAPCGG